MSRKNQQQEQDFFFKGFNNSVAKAAQKEEFRRIQKTFSQRDQRNQIPSGYYSSRISRSSNDDSSRRRRYERDIRRGPREDLYSTIPKVRRRSRSLPVLPTTSHKEEDQVSNTNNNTGAEINPMVKFIHANTGINLNSNIHFGLLIGGAIVVALISSIIVYKKITTDTKDDDDDGNDMKETESKNGSDRSTTQPSNSQQQQPSVASSSNTPHDALRKLIEEVDDDRRTNIAHVVTPTVIPTHDSIIVVLTVLGDDPIYINDIASRIDHAFKYASIPNRVDFLIIHHTARRSSDHGSGVSILNAYDQLMPLLNYKSRIVVQCIDVDEAMGCLHARYTALQTLNAISSMKKKKKIEKKPEKKDDSSTEFVLWIGKADKTLLVKSWDSHCISQWKIATRASMKDEGIGSHGDIDPGRRLKMPKDSSGMRREVIITCLPPSMKEACNKLQSVYDAEGFAPEVVEGGGGATLKGGRIVTKSFLIDNPTQCPGTWQSFQRWQDEVIVSAGAQDEKISIPVSSSDARFFTTPSLSNQSKRSIRSGDDESTSPNYTAEIESLLNDGGGSSGRPIMTPWYCGQFAFGRIISFKMVPFDPRLTNLSLKETDAIHALRWWCSHGILYNPSHLLAVNIPKPISRVATSSSSSLRHNNHYIVRSESLRVIGRYHAALKNMTSSDDSYDHPSSDGKIHYPRQKWIMFRFPELYDDFARLSGLDWRLNAVTIHGRMGIVRYYPLFMKERDILLKYDNSQEYEKQKQCQIETQ